MNLVEAVGLLEAVTAFQFKASEKQPKVTIYDNQTEGLVLLVKADLVNQKYKDYLEENAKSRKLRIRESNGYLMIYG